jgi:UPF0042 nucleotide-binding protein
LPTLTEQLDTEEHAPERVAVGVDARNLPRQLLAFKSIIKALKNQQVETEVIFLDADPGTLLERFSATRRRHPLSDDDRTLADAIEYEAHLLADIRMLADLVIDTSSLDVHTLRNLIRQRVARRDVNLSLLIESFGYKNGLPRDADLVFDVRALPNPHWHNELPARAPGERADAGRHSPLSEPLAAHLRGQRPQLCDGGRGLHRRPSPFGLYHRAAGPPAA